MSCGIPALYDSRQIGITASLHTIYMKRCSNPYCVPLKFLKRYLCGITHLTYVIVVTGTTGESASVKSYCQQSYVRVNRSNHGLRQV